MPTLVFEIEDGTQIVAPLEGRTTIGSAEGNDIVAEREGIAPHHAEVFQGMDGVWWVRDRNSATGTFLNGARVMTHRISQGDQLFLGSISARFVADAEAAGKETPASAGQGSPMIDRDIEGKRRELSKVGEALALARAQFEKTVGEQQDRLRALREQAAGLEAAAGTKRQELSILGSALANAQARMDKDARTHESRVARLQEEAVRLEADIGARQQQFNALAGALRDAEKTIDESKIPVPGIHENRKKPKKRGKFATAQPSNQPLGTERLQSDIADLEARKAAMAGAVEQLETARQRGEEALKITALKREQADIDLERLNSEKRRLEEDVRRLGEQSGGLGLEVPVLEMRKTELLAILEGLDKRHAEAVGKVDAIAEELRGTTARHDRALADAEKAEARGAELRTIADEVATRVRVVQSELESQTSARENLVALNRKLEGEVAAIGNRLAELSGAEERLGRARAELERIEGARLSLKTDLGELTRRREATELAARELETHIAGLKEARIRLDEETPALKQARDEALRELAVFKDEAEKSRGALIAELGRLRGDVSRKQAQLNELLREAGQARLHQAELERRNRELEAATKDLGEVRAGFQAAEVEKKKLEAKVQVLRKACSDAQLRLAELEDAEKSAGLRMSRLTSQEAELQRAVKQLGDEQERERKRFEELQSLSRDVEQAGERRKEQVAAEIAGLEARLARARSWSAEIDGLYEKLGKLPDASPEGREAWLEIQRRRGEITEQLPSGIQVRPKSRPTVVPRAR